MPLFTTALIAFLWPSSSLLRVKVTQSSASRLQSRLRSHPSLTLASLASPRLTSPWLTCSCSDECCAPPPASFGWHLRLASPRLGSGSTRLDSGLALLCPSTPRLASHAVLPSSSLVAPRPRLLRCFEWAGKSTMRKLAAQLLRVRGGQGGTVSFFHLDGLAMCAQPRVTPSVPPHSRPRPTLGPLAIRPSDAPRRNL